MSVTVHWQCRAYAKNHQQNDPSTMEQPANDITGEALNRIKKLNVFEPCTHQIGDRSFYILRENDIVMMKEEWKRLEKATMMTSGVKAALSGKAGVMGKGAIPGKKMSKRNRAMVKKVEAAKASKEEEEEKGEQT